MDSEKAAGVWLRSLSIIMQIVYTFKAEIRIMRHVSNIKSNTIGLLQLIAHFAKHYIVTR